MKPDQHKLGGAKGGRKVDAKWLNPRKRKDYTPVTVPFAATQTGETPEISAWAHSAVWTDRMLDTLNVGVRGGKWHTLIDKVFNMRNLYASARKVLGKKGAAGVDHQSVEDFSEDALTELDRLHEQLRGDLYQPLAVRRTWIPKPGSNEKRPLGIPTFPAKCTWTQRAFGLGRDRASVSSTSRETVSYSEVTLRSRRRVFDSSGLGSRHVFGPAPVDGPSATWCLSRRKRSATLS